MSWTEERVALLKQLWGEGKTAAEIATHLGQGVTRNAVIGKAHRLKLSSRVSPVQQKASANTNTRTDAPQHNAPAPESREETGANIAPAEDDESTPKLKRRKNGKDVPGAVKGVKMQALRERMCRWPIGDPQEDDFHFCGGRTASGATYCKKHADVAYQSSARKSMKLDDVQANGETEPQSAATDDASPEEERSVSETAT